MIEANRFSSFSPSFFEVLFVYTCFESSKHSNSVVIYGWVDKITEATDNIRPANKTL